MKNNHLKIISLVLIATSFGTAGDGTKITFHESIKDRQKIAFTENKGQVSDQYYIPRPDILFSGSAHGMTYHLRNNGISYQLMRADSRQEEKRSAPSTVIENNLTKTSGQTSIYRLDVNWLGINNNFTIRTEKALDGFCNYYSEVCPTGVSGVKTYEDVFYNNIYNKISLHYYQKNNGLKYDYIVEPGGDYRQIQFEVAGAKKIILQDDGSLLFNTPLGNIQEGAPVVYQGGRPLPASWMVANNVLRFEIESYDSTKELIIDPDIRSWGTYYGGAGDDYGTSCATDAGGNVYLAGQSDSNTGTTIATSGSHQSVIGGVSDAFLVKFNPGGVRQWSTYYGGTGSDYARSCTADANGDVYLAGYTNSNSGTVIAGTGSHQSTNGGNYDAFLVKFNSGGVRQWGTYYGDTGDEIGFSCSTDANGNVYLAGETTSGTSPAISTAGGHQPAFGGIWDGFLVKFNSGGVRQWGTYYGGTGEDQAPSCSTDAVGNVYLSGWTASNSATVMATPGGHQTGFTGGPYDAFIVKFNSSGLRLWGTYYGGSGYDRGTSCSTDAAGNVYLSGYTDTNTGTVIATAGSHQPGYAGGGAVDAFLVKFNSSGIRQWSTYYGGTGDDEAYSCSTDGNGNVYLAGYTKSNSGTAIATANSFQPVAGGAYDAFLVKFNPIGIRQWGTYYGAAGDEFGSACYGDTYGNAYFSGSTASNTDTRIASTGSHQSASGGGSEAFLVKFCNAPAISVNGGSMSVICSGETTTLTASGANNYTWSTGATGATVVISPSLAMLYTYSVTGSGSSGCTNVATAQVQVNDCLEINEAGLKEFQLLIYPNPNKGEFIITCGCKISLNLVNGSGKVMRVIRLSESNNYEASVSELPNGLYFITGSNNRGIISRKIVVIK